MGGGWVGGQYITKLRLISTQVKVEVEVGVKLGNSNSAIAQLTLDVTCLFRDG